MANTHYSLTRSLLFNLSTTSPRPTRLPSAQTFILFNTKIIFMRLSSCINYRYHNAVDAVAKQATVLPKITNSPFQSQTTKITFAKLSPSPGKITGKINPTMNFASLKKPSGGGHPLSYRNRPHPRINHLHLLSQNILPLP